MGHIRKKFSGRGKRTSTITDRCVVLVGLRHWEKEAKNCDILEVYSANEVEQLKNIPKVRFERLLPLIMTGAVVESVKKIDDAFDFGFGRDDSELIDTDAADVKEPLSGETFEMDVEQIDIDDI
jgi:hypothetical protein